MTLEIHFLEDYPNFKHTIAQWYINQWGTTYPERSLDEWTASLKLNKATLPITFIALNKIDGNSTLAVGTVTLRSGNPKIFGDDKTIELTSLYVPDAYRGNGIATALISAACKHAEILHYQQIKLFTFGNGAIYKKNSWLETATTYYKDRQAIIFKRSLPMTSLATPCVNKLVASTLNEVEPHKSLNSSTNSQSPTNKDFK